MSEKRRKRPSIERQSRSIFIVVHPRKIIFGIDVPCPAKKELLERLLCARTERISETAESDFDGEALGSFDRHQLKVIWECPRPV